MKEYQVFYEEKKSIIVSAKNEEEAEEIVKSGEFVERETISEGVDLSSVEAIECD